MTTDMRPNLYINLTRPWDAADTSATAPLPSFEGTLDIQPSTLDYDGHRFNDVEALVKADFNGLDPDASKFAVHGLRIQGQAVDVALSATATSVMTDPPVDGEFTGRVNIGKLPPSLV